MYHMFNLNRGIPFPSPSLDSARADGLWRATRSRPLGGIHALTGHGIDRAEGRSEELYQLEGRPGFVQQTGRCSRGLQRFAGGGEEAKRCCVTDTCMLLKMHSTVTSLMLEHKHAFCNVQQADNKEARTGETGEAAAAPPHSDRQVRHEHAFTYCY